MALGDLPDVLTVEEAAAVLRISRGLAYEAARQWRATGGRHGLPVVMLGSRSLRVPRAALEELLATPGRLRGGEPFMSTRQAIPAGTPSGVRPRR